MHVKEVLNPKKPFVAIVAGSKYDTKIGPLTAMYERVDKIILGGVMYNTYLCAKYGVKIAGVEVILKAHDRLLELLVVVPGPIHKTSIHATVMVLRISCE